ncbi:MAG: transglutaminase domain-containing protein [Thermodesulfobacteriota bacterium]|nr:transglutaminase domain-containing protein [Thermodesulfobacteriota bacterium]
MRRRWLQRSMVLALLLGIFACAAPQKKQQDLLTTRGRICTLYSLVGDEVMEAQYEKQITAHVPSPAELQISPGSNHTYSVEATQGFKWAHQEMEVLEDTWATIPFWAPPDEIRMDEPDLQVCPSYRPTVRTKYIWFPGDGREVQGVHNVRVKTITRHLPISSATPFPFHDWPSAVDRYVNFDSEWCQNLDMAAPEVRDLADSITAGCETELEAVIRIFDWVKTNILYGCAYDIMEEYPDYKATIPEILAVGKENCLGHAKLEVALLRNAGIPARQATGRSINITEVSELGSHVLVDVFFADIGWVIFESTREGYILSNMAHIGEGSYGWLTNVCSTVAIAPVDQQQPARSPYKELDIPAGQPAAAVFYLEMWEYADYTLTGEFVTDEGDGAQEFAERCTFFPPAYTKSPKSEGTIPVVLFMDPTDASEERHVRISVEEDPDAYLDLIVRPQENVSNPPFIVDGKVGPSEGSRETPFVYQGSLLWDVVGGAAPTSLDLDLVVDKPDGTSESFTITQMDRRPDEYLLEKAATYPDGSGVYEYLFSGACDSGEVRGEIGRYGGPEVIPPGGREDRDVHTGDVPDVIQALERTLAVEVTDIGGSPRFDLTVTNEGAYAYTTLVAEFTLMHLAQERSMGIFRKNLGLVLPGKSKTLAWAPKLPLDARPGAYKFMFHAFSIMERGRGRFIHEIGFREIAFGTPSLGSGGGDTWVIR